MTATIPGATYMGNWSAGSPEWHTARTGALGGSEVAAILGLSPWESRFSLWHRKAGRIGPQADNPLMEWGRRLEPAIITKFSDEHPELSLLFAGTYRNNERPYQIATPDMLLSPACGCDLICDCGHEPFADEILEAKTAYDDMEWGEPGTDQCPPYYLAQTRWYLDTLGKQRCHLAVLIHGSDYREYVIERDEDDQALMRERAVEFLDTMRRGEKPDIDAHSATYQAIRELHPAINGEDADIDPMLAEAYITACEQYKQAVADKQQAVSRVLDAMGDARRACVLGQPFAIRVAQNHDALPHLRPARARKADAA